MLHGTGDWSHDGKFRHELAPGAVFHNLSWQAHSMRSGDQPLMAPGLYLPPFGGEGGLL